MWPQSYMKWAKWEENEMESIPWWFICNMYLYYSATVILFPLSTATWIALSSSSLSLSSLSSYLLTPCHAIANPPSRFNKAYTFYPVLSRLQTPMKMKKQRTERTCESKWSPHFTHTLTHSLTHNIHTLSLSISPLLFFYITHSPPTARWIVHM